MKKFILPTIFLFLLAGTAKAAITSASQLSDSCVNTPSTCTAEENAFLDGQTATQNSSSNNQGQAAQLNNQGKNATVNTATQINNAPVQTTQTQQTPQSCGSACNLGYTPLEPIPGITSDDGQGISFPKMIRNIYYVAIVIGALFSVLMLTLSGIRYMLSDVVTDKSKAIQRIKACLYGLVLIAASYLILNTINPQLVKFSLNPTALSQNANSIRQTTPGATGSIGGGSTAPAQITIGTLQPGQSTNVYSSSDTSGVLTNLMSQCGRNGGSIHQTGQGSDAQGAFVMYDLDKGVDATISAYNLVGQKLMNDIPVRGNGEEGIQRLNLDVHNQVVIIKVAGEQNVTTKKIVTH